MATTQLANNLTLSVAFTPSFTVPANTTTVSFSSDIKVPLPLGDSIEIVLQVSKDGGTTWSTFDDEQYVSGPISRGPTAGLQATQHVSGEINNLVTGNKLRAGVLSIIGSDTWTASNISITTS